MKVRFFARSDVGRKRLTNEDCYYCSADGGFCVLADGMGGHQSGEVASQMAVEIVSDYFHRSGPRVQDYREKPLDRVRAMIADLVEEWTENANALIYQRGGGGRGGSLERRMGTTIAILYIVEGFAVLAHVGDSRIYRFRQGGLTPLTRDHSIVQDQVTTVEMAGEERRARRRKKFITRALGTRPVVKADIQVQEVAASDLFVLCSDGLTDMVSEGEIRTVLRRDRANLERAVEELIFMANEKGGRDNITVILGEVVEETEDTEAIAYLVDSRAAIEDSTEKLPELEPPPPAATDSTPDQEAVS